MLKAITVLEKAVSDPGRGLPEPIFYYISRTTPMINVDLLVTDPQRGILLAWRDDKHAGIGWHLPGGIIRYRETINQRIHAVALQEIGSPVSCAPGPIAVNQIFADPPKRDRAHFISLLYRCEISSNYRIDNGGRAPTVPGYLAWHNRCPDDLLTLQEIYRPHIDQAISGQ
ncbi:MAG: NUDIX domain-containing protein [Lamprobacter sp.]|uniref:NUDIX domain-containing protein n=1 Tax=Lamprobacter sp. TaxID=3100796 RepID=UPI002B262C68|nr:NUDIX domain-containing protein [Lamprobacter sp.]MEA3641487.1 NUDIX domain-containing protein [Lamprobacter sp.]